MVGLVCALIVGAPLPLAFEQNQGQAPKRYAFIAQTRPLALAADGFSVWLDDRDELSIRFLGAQPRARLVAEGTMIGETHYLIGKDPRRWRRHIPTFAALVARSVWPGIDVRFHARGAELEYDLTLAPHASLDHVRLAIAGASAVAVARDGSLVARARGGELRQLPPHVTQGARVLPARYLLHPDGTVGLEVEARDPALAMLIDPVVMTATYLSGMGNGTNDYAGDVAIDADRNIYVLLASNGGPFPGPNYPVTGAALSSPIHPATIAKLDPKATAVLAFAHVGGTDIELGRGLVLDAERRPVIVGHTTSTDFPQVHEAQTCATGGREAFVAMLTPALDDLLYATCLGGSGDDTAEAVALDNQGRAFVTGTLTAGFTGASGGLQTSPGSSASAAFLVRMSAANDLVPGSALEYGTYLSPADGSLSSATSVAIDGAGGVHVAGDTAATLLGCSSIGPRGGSDAFYLRLKISTSTPPYEVDFARCVGGGADEHAFDLALGTGGGAYVVGNTISTDFPVTLDALLPDLPYAMPQTRAGMILRFDASGGQSYGSYFGDVGNDDITSVADGGDGIVWLSGTTESDWPNFPITNDAFRKTRPSAGQSLFLTQLSPSDMSIVFSTFFNPANYDPGVNLSFPTIDCRGLVANAFGSVWMTGTLGGYFATTEGVHQEFYRANGDVIVIRVGDLPFPALTSVTPSSGPTAGGTSITVNGQGFSDGLSLSIGGAPASSVVVQSSTELSAVTPPGAAGSATISLTTPEGETASLTPYTYVPPPAVSSVAPQPASTEGGTVLVIEGVDFQVGASVTIAGMALVQVGYVSSTELIVVAPPLSAGPQAIVVTNPDGQSTAASVTYAEPLPPSIAGVTPASGPAAGGTVVEITGSEFRAGAAVSIGGVTVAEVAVLSTTRLRVTTPGGEHGRHSVVVENPDGRSAAFDGFDYVHAPVLDGLSPSEGSTLGGEEVSVSGAFFMPGMTLSFGDAAVETRGLSATSAVVTTPAHAAGIVAITVANPDGQSATRAQFFTFAEASGSGEGIGDGEPTIGELDPRSSGGRNTGCGCRAPDEATASTVLNVAALALLRLSLSWRRRAFRR